MSKTKALTAAAVLILAHAAHAVPLRELVEEQRGAMTDEIAKKRAEARRSSAEAAAVGAGAGAPAAAINTTRTTDVPLDIEQATVVAVYGEVGKLTADIALRGSVPAALKEGYEVVPGWFIESISPQRVSFVRGRKKAANAKRHVVYLSEPATVASAQARGIAPASGLGSSLPPMPAPMLAPLPPSQAGGNGQVGQAIKR